MSDLRKVAGRLAVALSSATEYGPDGEPLSPLSPEAHLRRAGLTQAEALACLAAAEVEP